ncbi:MAG: hypothetical protein HUJ87_14060 [Fusobacterium varium]|uniref:hypothetical protein n=1 Tax=Fusobacterium varium TaxID=856 RepID=UPI00243129CE|nr:hypothetical protein [Fusobacterium varium]MCF0171615.1 hypothetical protein [Fusobacterium varium]
MKERKSGITYKKATRKRKKKMAELERLCRIDWRIENNSLIEKLNISKTEFYRNYKKKADELRKINSKESLFNLSHF